MAIFDATTDFSEAMSEVSVLVDAATLDNDNQYVYNKAAILLLAAKFEAFVEHIIEEFCFKLSQMDVSCECLSNAIRINASKKLINNDFICALDQCKESKIIPTLKALSLYWKEGCKPVEIKVDCSFNYGKHGEKEVKRLFNRIGVDDVFEVCKVSDIIESINDENEQNNYSISADINAITGYRNSIIHNDNTPSLTYDQIKRYCHLLKMFSEKLDLYLANNTF